MKKLLTVSCIAMMLLLCLSIFAACGNQTEVTESKVTKVELNKKGTEIAIEAVLTEADLETFRASDIYNQKLYLIALEPGDTAAAAAGKQPLAEVSMSTSPKFTVDLYADGNLQAHSRLHCSFGVAVYNKTLASYVLLTSPAYVSNVSVLAENQDEFPSSASIKGLHSTISSDAAYLGVSHTVIELDPSVLILDGYTDNAHAYVYDGQTYYLSRSALDALDKQVTEATAQGSIVYFRLRMHTAPERANALVSCLYADGAATKGDRTWAIWMDDDKSASLMAGFLDFIAARYTDPAGTYGLCGAFIIGRSVNESNNNNNAGAVEFGEYVSRYSALVRLAHSTLKSHYANGRVYISVSNNLSNTDALGTQVDWTTNYFLDQFNVEALKGGDFDWNVAISAYHYKSSDPMWSDEHANALTLSPAHVSDFMWIAQSNHFYAGAQRHTIISDFEVAPGTDANTQAASYAYAYYKVLEHGGVDALIYSAHTDAQSLISGSGLWATDSKGNLTERRAIYNVFMTIDTKDTTQLGAIGISSLIPGWSSLYDAQASKAATRRFVTGSDMTEKPSNKHQLLFHFTDGTADGFTADDSVAYLELTKDATLGWPVLGVHTNRTHPTTYTGISNTTLQGSDLKGAKAFALTMCAAVDTESPVSVKLRLYKHGDKTLSSGNGSIVYEDVTEITAGTWQTVYFDVSEFASLVEGDDPITVSVQIMATNIAENGACTLLLDRVEMYGKFGMQAYEWLIIVVSILAVLGLIGGLLYLLYSKYGAPTVIANVCWNLSKGKIKLRRYKKAKR